MVLLLLLGMVVETSFGILMLSRDVKCNKKVRGKYQSLSYFFFTRASSFKSNI